MRRRSLLSAGAASLASGCLGFGVNDDNTQAEEHTGNQDSENQETDSSDEDEQSKSDEDGQSKVAETGNLIIAETRWLTKFDNTISGLDSLHSQIDSILQSIHNDPEAATVSQVDEVNSLIPEHQDYYRDIIEHYTVSPNWERGEEQRKSIVENLRKAIELEDAGRIQGAVEDLYYNGMFSRGLQDGGFDSHEGGVSPATITYSGDWLADESRRWGGTTHNILYLLIRTGVSDLNTVTVVENHGDPVDEFSHMDYSGKLFDTAIADDNVVLDQSDIDSPSDYIASYFYDFNYLTGDPFYYILSDASSRDFEIPSMLAWYDSQKAAADEYESMLSEVVVENRGDPFDKIAWQNQDTPVYGWSIQSDNITAICDVSNSQSADSYFREWIRNAIKIQDGEERISPL